MPLTGPSQIPNAIPLQAPRRHRRTGVAAGPSRLALGQDFFEPPAPALRIERGRAEIDPRRQRRRRPDRAPRRRGRSRARRAVPDRRARPGATRSAPSDALTSSSRRSSASIKRGRVRLGGEDVGGGQRVGAAEPAVEMHRLDAHPVDREVGERRVELGLGIALEITLAARKGRDGARSAPPTVTRGWLSGSPRSGGLVNSSEPRASTARFLVCWASVGEQEQRRAVEIAGANRPRSSAARRRAPERRQGAGARNSHEPLGLRRRARRARSSGSETAMRFVSFWTSAPAPRRGTGRGKKRGAAARSSRVPARRRSGAERARRLNIRQIGLS